MPVMGSAAARPIQLGCFDVQGGSVIIADDSLPVAVEADAVSGSVTRVFSWPLSPGHRGRAAALSILSLEDSILVASPAAGGIVDIDRRSGEVRVIPLEADVGALISCGEAVWAVASPDWFEDTNEPQQQEEGRPDRKRTVVWEEPDEAEIARFGELTRRMRFEGASLDEQGWGRRTAADWREADGDYEELLPATPLWRVRAGVATRIEADLEQPILAAAGDRIVGVCRLPTDPIIKHITPYGSVSWRYPGTVAVIDDAGTLEVIGPVPGSGGVVCADHERVWLLGFGQETDDDPAPQARQVLLGEGRVAAPLAVRLQRPVAVLDGFVVDIKWPGSPGGAAGRRTGARGDREGAVVRFVPVDGGDPREAEPADLTPDTTVWTGGGEVWFGNPGTSTLAVAAPGTSSLRELRIGIDCRPWMPQPQLPAGFDVDRFEQSQLDRLRESFLGGWHTEDGDMRPFIEGVSFDTVELRGHFPGRQIVALFHAQDRPGIQFGRHWWLYDELGNPVEHEYADIGLMEDIESAGGGLPAPASCLPDSDGVVWFQ
jgi:hypothetical protein